jgi:hypothetical protein
MKELQFFFQNPEKLDTITHPKDTVSLGRTFAI